MRARERCIRWSDAILQHELKIECCIRCLLCKAYTTCCTLHRMVVAESSCIYRKQDDAEVAAKNKGADKARIGDIFLLLETEESCRESGLELRLKKHDRK